MRYAAEPVQSGIVLLSASGALHVSRLVNTTQRVSKTAADLIIETISSEDFVSDSGFRRECRLISVNLYARSEQDSKSVAKSLRLPSALISSFKKF